WPVEHYLAMVNLWARSLGALIACLMLVGVAVRAATAISGERDRQTLDSLLTTPLTSSAILFAKWLGSLASIRWGWLWLGLIWGLWAILGNLHPLAVPVMLAAWFVYAGFLALLGLWFSLISSTSVRATAGTLFSTLALGAGLSLL